MKYRYRVYRIGLRSGEIPSHWRDQIDLSAGEHNQDLSFEEAQTFGVQYGIIRYVEWGSDRTEYLTRGGTWWRGKPQRFGMKDNVSMFEVHDYTDGAPMLYHDAGEADAKVRRLQNRIPDYWPWAAVGLALGVQITAAFIARGGCP